VYSIGDNVFGICWAWDPLACSIRGLLWHSNEEGHRQARFIWEGLSRLGLTHTHGLLPALLTLQVEITEMRVWIDNQAEAIMASQIRTGHHAYADGSFSARERGSGHDFPMLDLAMMSKRVCGLAINITTSALCLQRIVQLADFILEDASNSIRNQQLVITDSTKGQHSFDHAGSIIQRTRSAKRQAEGLLAEAEAWKHKATIMVQTLLSLTTQRDQSISISIAEDSRTLARKVTRDSKSKKAIAAVTMCFLPGTFVSSLFAMSMFDWNAGAGSSATVDRRFWIYWAVTLPLTVAVIVVWLVRTNKDLLPSARKLKGRRPKTEKHEEICIPAQT
jgi:Mg2+ and Co2+ transporter CorA